MKEANEHWWPPDEELFTPDEVAAILRISRPTFYRLIHAGRLPHVRVVDSIRVTARSLKKFMHLGEEDAW